MVLSKLIEFSPRKREKTDKHKRRGKRHANGRGGEKDTDR